MFELNKLGVGFENHKCQMLGFSLISILDRSIMIGVVSRVKFLDIEVSLGYSLYLGALERIELCWENFW